MRISVRGSWPDPVQLRYRWHRADARLWNRYRTEAVLRPLSSSSAFLEACADELVTLGAEGVVSQPLQAGATDAWRRAGFRPYLSLDLFRHAMSSPVPDPTATVTVAAEPDWEAIVGLDHRAFPELWTLEADGLVEATTATSTSATHTVSDEEGNLAGYAITGVTLGTGYLQRVAVDPVAQGRGYGRSLVRASLRWARNRGATSMLLNTQPENGRSAHLYTGEGFIRVPERLALLRR